MSMDANAIADVLRGAVPGAQVDPSPSIDMPVLYVDRESWPAVARVLRDETSLQFQFLSDVIGADYHPREPRFEVVYLLVSLGVQGLGPQPASAKRLRVKVRVPGADPRIPTMTELWPGANWPEREVYDLLGITFEGHPDMRRVLMPEDWEGYPLRKDYPVQIRRGVKVYAPLQLSTEEFASNMERVRRASMETGQEGLAREGKDVPPTRDE